MVILNHAKTWIHDTMVHVKQYCQVKSTICFGFDASFDDFIVNLLQQQRGEWNWQNVHYTHSQLDYHICNHKRGAVRQFLVVIYTPLEELLLRYIWETR